MSKEEKDKIPPKLLNKAFGVVYDYRDNLIEMEAYEEVIALDKLIAHIKTMLST
jgi:hypothetical protein